jgi:hypothetical protein
MKPNDHIMMFYQVDHVIVFPRRESETSGIELEEMGVSVINESSVTLEQASVCEAIG